MEPIPVETLDDPRVAAFRNIPDPDRLRADGTFVVEGRLAVRRLLAGARFQIVALLLTDTAYDAIGAGLQELPADVPVFLASRTVIREIGGYDFHQGCLALAARGGSRDPVGLMRHGRAVEPVVILEQVGNPDNVGGVFRNAAAFGASAVLLSPGCCDPLYRKAVRTSIATTLEVPFAVLDDWPDGLRTLGGYGFELVALTPDPSAACLSLYVVPPAPRRVALMLGNEGQGLTPEVMALADRHVRIATAPPVDSLNVATAAALALYHLQQARFNERGGVPGSENTPPDGR